MTAGTPSARNGPSMSVILLSGRSHRPAREGGPDDRSRDDGALALVASGLPWHIDPCEARWLDPWLCAVPGPRIRIEVA